jgi:hypothetical protein
VRGHVGVRRREVLLAGLLLLGGCTSTPPPPPPPDPLAELAARARADAVLAEAVAGSVPALAGAAGTMAQVRSEHALALQREVDRERPPVSSAPRPETSAPPAPPAPDAAKAALLAALTAAEGRIAELIGTVPRYRAGLLGSVAAGCASLREVLA